MRAQQTGLRWARPQSGADQLRHIKGGAVIKSEDKSTVVQLRRKTKLSTLIGLIIMHAIYRRIFIL